jgi:hypothetical protein
MNLHAQFRAAEHSADFTLLISAYDHDSPTKSTDGHNVCTVASLSIDDPQLQEKLRLIAQAYRMGARFGKENP